MLATVTKFMVVCGVAVGSRYSVSCFNFSMGGLLLFFPCRSLSTFLDM